MFDIKKTFKCFGLKAPGSRFRQLEADEATLDVRDLAAGESAEQSRVPRSALGCFLQKMKRGSSLTGFQKKGLSRRRSGRALSEATRGALDLDTRPADDREGCARSAKIRRAERAGELKKTTAKTPPSATRARTRKGSGKRRTGEARSPPDREHEPATEPGSGPRASSRGRGSPDGAEGALLRKSKEKGRDGGESRKKAAKCGPTGRSRRPNGLPPTAEKGGGSENAVLARADQDVTVTRVARGDERHKKSRRYAKKIIGKLSPTLVLLLQRALEGTPQVRRTREAAPDGARLRLVLSTTAGRTRRSVTNAIASFLDCYVRKRLAMHALCPPLATAEDQPRPAPLRRHSAPRALGAERCLPRKRPTTPKTPPVKSADAAERANHHSRSKTRTPVEVRWTKSASKCRRQSTSALKRPPTPTSISPPKVGLSDFRIIKLIGKGGFGEVYLAEYIRSKKMMALKVLDKRLSVAKKKQQLFNEHAVLSKSCQTPFLLSLYYSFESEHYVYFAMKYCPGGDLRTLLNVVGALDEQDARLYMAEVIYSVDALHKLGYIHRDLKPDNFLIDKNGHLVLADFGLSKENPQPYYGANLTPHFKRDDHSATSSILLGEQQLDVLNTDNLYSKFKRTRTAAASAQSTSNADPVAPRGPDSAPTHHPALAKTPPPHTPPPATSSPSGKYHRDSTPRKSPLSPNPLTPQQRRVMAYSIVGSPDYMSPEVLAKNGYGCEIDWWSIGCLFFELTMGVPPFFADTVEGVFYNIGHWETKLPEVLRQCDQSLSPESLDLITILLCKFESRAKLRGIENFKHHPYFKNISWDNLYSHTPPFVPILRDIEDTSYFQPMTIKEQKMIPVDLLSRRS
ncbi:uncharacterized protein LOC126319917 [Schistocerca gregaria]|uniref:uncharacterized protein LOC126319917 n=1 Tax=Schistocerca gregaria TaxID=7010 RepID=UPI00211F3A20|nr:uncharacterized protein LOC126319917 [Schistocerca gregaria]